MRRAPRRRTTQIASAHHEAGHAVARVLLGIAGDVDFASIHPDDFGTDALGIVCGRPWIPPTCGHAVDHEAVRARVVVLLSGPAAESRYTSRDKTGCGGDVEQSFATLAAAYLDTAETVAHAALRESEPLDFGKRALASALADVVRRFEECNAHAQALVEANWPVIEAVACQLARRKRLTGAEVRAIVERAR